MFWLSAFIDVPADPFEQTVAFWSAVTGWSPSPRRGVDGEFLTLDPGEGADDHLRLQRLGSGEARIHLDLHVAEPRAEAHRAVDLGATEVFDGGVDRAYVVLQSPGGLFFCLVTHPASRPAPPSRWPDLSTSLVDQVCLDVPRSAYDVETGFWQELLGWDRTGSSFREFERLVRPEGQALRILLQRLDDQDGPTRAHLDVACSARDREVVRHASLGARLVDERESWTVLSDPSGLRYCLTDRPPG